MYETQDDLANENYIKDLLAIAWDAKLHKLPRSYYVDWMITKKGKAQGFAELKCRNNDRRKYPTLMLSLHKWMHGKELASEIGGSFIIIVRWNDGTFYHKQGSCKVSYGIGGRTDRGDSQDIEPVVYIPTDYFKRIT